MPDDNWNKLKEIFHAAVALPPDERPAYLDQACNGGVSFRAAVESLLKSHEKSNFVDGSANKGASEILIDGAELKSGQTVGHYGIVSLLAKAAWGKCIWPKIRRDTADS